MDNLKFRSKYFGQKAYFIPHPLFERVYFLPQNHVAFAPFSCVAGLFLRYCAVFRKKIDYPVFNWGKISNFFPNLINLEVEEKKSHFFRLTCIFFAFFDLVLTKLRENRVYFLPQKFGGLFYSPPGGGGFRAKIYILVYDTVRQTVPQVH